MKKTEKKKSKLESSLGFIFTAKINLQKLNFVGLVTTLRELIFAGTNFRGTYFSVFLPFSRNSVPRNLSFLNREITTFALIFSTM